MMEERFIRLDEVKGNKDFKFRPYEAFPEYHGQDVRIGLSPVRERLILGLPDGGPGVTEIGSSR